MGGEPQTTQKRLVTIPGYHIRPKYDLQHLREKLQGGEKRDFDVVLPLTSMIDMFSMLVIFLLLNFSATGEAYFINKEVKLPTAKHGQAMESRPLISITSKAVSLDADFVGLNPETVDVKDLEMPQLVASLRRLDKLIKNQEQAGVKSKKGINLQADIDTDVIYVKRVMNVLISEGFTNINFIVRETPEEGAQ